MIGCGSLSTRKSKLRGERFEIHLSKELDLPVYLMVLDCFRNASDRNQFFVNIDAYAVHGNLHEVTQIARRIEFKLDFLVNFNKFL